MNEFILSCGSTVDLKPEHLEQRNIHVINFRFMVDNVEYVDDFGKSLTYEQLYTAMDAGKKTSTSQINSTEYVQTYEEFFKQGKDVISVVLSSGITGTYQAALMAKRELEEKYPQNKLYVIDSLCASSGYGMLIDMLADYRDEGHNVTEIVEYAEKIKKRIHHLFFSTDLSAYVRSGRVSAAAGLFGTLLHICPLLYVNPEGKLIPEKKLMGKKRAMTELLNEMIDRAQDGTDYNGRCYLCHSSALADALELEKMIENTFVNLKGKCVIYDIGATIGCHTGRGTVAAFFIGNERV